MVPNDAALRKVVLDEATGIAPALAPKGLHISCSTISPATSRELYAVHQRAQQRYVAAPVFARPDGIEQKTGTFVLSGDQSAMEESVSILRKTSSATYEFGPDAGAANVVKLCGNFMIAAAIESMAEALSLADKNDVDRCKVMDMLSETIFNCLIYNGYGKRVSRRNHKPGGFSLELGLKDVSLVHDTAQRSQAPMPLASLLRDRFLSAAARGRSDIDWSGIGLSVSEDAGLDMSDALADARAGGTSNDAPSKHTK